MHRASCRFMPFRGITETLSDVESVRVVHYIRTKDTVHCRGLQMYDGGKGMNKNLTEIVYILDSSFR